MNTLTMVRHGQASFLEADYDKLSTLGEKQAADLGIAWARSGHAVDHVYSGPRKRQRKTAEIAAEAYRRAGLDWPEVTILEDFDEYPAESLLRQHIQSLAERHADVRKLYSDFRDTRGTPRAAEAVEALFRTVTAMWVREEFDPGEVESWKKFEQRIMGAISLVQSSLTGDAHAVVFSSAGPTAVAVQKALNLDPMKALELSWLVRNCSCSEFFSEGSEITLRSFNTVPHGLGADWITYR